MSLSQITVIVVTFNSKHCIQELSSVLKNIPHLIIVDNASDDQTLALVESDIPQAIRVANLKNLGFGAANNQALKLVKTPYAFLLNPDCSISIEILESLYHWAEIYSDAAIIAPQLLKSNGEKDVSYRWPRSYWNSKGLAAEGPCCVGFTSGAALFLNLKNSKNLYFDESFFLYFEDDDICQRVFEEKSQIIVIPEIQLIHQLGGSVRYNKPLIAHYYEGFYMAQSNIIYVAKYQGLISARILRLKFFISSLFKISVSLFTLRIKKMMRYIGRLFAACYI
jgi:N-acetylglucosaminyl-diphospho-decaprenol L-rhamnosyltransferase